MNEQERSGPRRALGPVGEGSGDEAGSGRDDSPALNRYGRAGRAFPASPLSPDDWPEDLDTTLLRRLAPAGGVEPATPVPPPAPVLPGGHDLSASAGRRFSASADPSEYSPRRSATSVSSPPWPEAERPSTWRSPARATATATATAPAVGDPSPETVTEPPRPPRQRRGAKRAVILIAAVAVVALIVTGVVWAINQPVSTTSRVPTDPSQAALDPLPTPQDVAGLASLTWSESVPESPSTALPLCLSAATTSAERSSRRELVATDPTTGHLLGIVDTFADAATATTALSEYATQLAQCDEAGVLIRDGVEVTGLADQTVAVRLRLQGADLSYHLVLLAQTGRTISLVDLATAEDADAAELVAAVANPLERICSGGEGACPSLPEATSTLPAAGTDPGWLSEADLPRITAAAGRWGATEITSTLSVLGSQCEGVDLQRVSGTSDNGQRTLLLGDDPDAPIGFGVDQVTYSFNTAKQASAFVKKLSDNITSCSDRFPTATVAEGDSVKGSGAGAAAFTGSNFSVTQKTDASDTVPYRVGVLQVGTRVGYLLANPSADFDFSDAQWKSILVRAGQRISQAG